MFLTVNPPRWCGDFQTWMLLSASTFSIHSLDGQFALSSTMQHEILISVLPRRSSSCWPLTVQAVPNIEQKYNSILVSHKFHPNNSSQQNQSLQESHPYNEFHQHSQVDQRQMPLWRHPIQLCTQVIERACLSLRYVSSPWWMRQYDNGFLRRDAGCGARTGLVDDVQIFGMGRAYLLVRHPIKL